MIRLERRFTWMSSGIINLMIIIPIAFFLISTSGGLNTTSDSSRYIEMARNFHDHNELSLDDETMFIYWPPVYPLTLSFILQMPGSALRLFNLFLFFASLIAWYYLADREFKKSWFFKVLISTSAPFLMVFVFIWSESIFLLLFSGYIVFLYRYFRSGNRMLLYIAAIAGSLALLTRHAGIFLIPGFCAGLSIGWTKKTTNEKRDIILHILIVISGFLCWNLYNIIFKDQTFVVAELFSTYNGVRNITQTLGELGASFFPSQLSTGISIATGFIVLVLAMYSGFRARNPFYLSLTVSLLIYIIAWFVISASIYDISRFMAVVLPIVFLLLAKGFNENPGLGKGKIVYALFLIWLIYPLMRIFINSLLWGGQIQFYNDLKNLLPGISV